MTEFFGIIHRWPDSAHPASVERILKLTVLLQLSLNLFDPTGLKGAKPTHDHHLN